MCTGNLDFNVQSANMIAYSHRESLADSTTLDRLELALNLSLNSLVG